MILSSATIAHLIRTTKAIEPTSEERLKSIEGNAYDLTLNRVFSLAGRSPKFEEYSPYKKGDEADYMVFFGVKTRRTPLAVEIPWYKTADGRLLIKCEPQVPYLLESIEIVTPPEGVEIEIIRRSSVFRSGGIMDKTYVPYGFSGHVYVSLFIPKAGRSITWEKGARFCSTKWFAVEKTGIVKYTGIWGGDKVSTDGEERAY